MQFYSQRRAKSEETRVKLSKDPFVLENWRNFVVVCSSRGKKMPFPPVDQVFQLDGDKVVINDVVWSHVIKRIVNSSSPGVPLAHDFRDNGEWIGQNPALVKSLAEKRIAKLLYGDRLYHRNFEESYFNNEEALGLVEENYCCPARVFLKKEFTKVTKEPRPVFSVSVIDSIVDIILFSDLIQAEIDDFINMECTAGIDIIDNTLPFWNKLVELEKENGKPFSSNDIQGWDWSVDHDLLTLIFYVLFHQRTGRFLDEFVDEVEADSQEESDFTVYQKLVSGRLHCVKHVLCQLTDGLLFALPFSVLPSGWRLTTKGGSVGRALMSYFVQKQFPPPFVRCQGDDCLEPKLEQGMAQVYGSFGYVITDTIVCEGESYQKYNFCSQVFTSEGSYPESWLKPYLKLMTQDVFELGQFQDFLRNYGRSQDRAEIFRKVVEGYKSIMPNAWDEHGNQMLLSMKPYFT